ncbi:MAG: SCO family protein [Gallionella sp.]|nr:SCO family protein [Gallionella sp.]
MDLVDIILTNQNFKKSVIMRHYLLPLSLAVLLSAAMPCLAQDPDTGGMQMYKASVAAAKLQAPQEETSAPVFDEKEVLKISQGAIGNQLGDYTFTDRSGRAVRLSDYRGKPLVISMIYTQCPIICATTTRSLSALKLSQDALGADSFGVLTVGFDAENDTPEAMGDFARRMDINLPNWEFVSADQDTIKKLSKDLGFVFFPSAEGGFSHITQTTYIDKQGKVYLHVYGDELDNKTLLEPLKNMIYNVKSTDPIYNFATAESGFAGIAKSVRLFCTVYDTKTGKYTVDYSFFYGIGLGILVSLLITWWIVIEYRRSPKRDSPSHG